VAELSGWADQAIRVRDESGSPDPTSLTDSKDGSMNTRPGPTIEVFADIWCPFTHVGLRTIEEQRTRSGRTDVAIWVRAWPLELVNGAPLDPAVTKEHADDLRAQVAPNLFCHLDLERFPHSTLDALGLANRAYRIDLKAGERVSLALRDALFEEGRDISDPVTLESLARDLGVAMPDESDRAGVVADWHEGVRRGVLGSPHFFCGDADVFCPSLDITKDPVHGVSIVRDARRLTEFLDRCLAQPGAG
jgi:predicted DsbA family dithiol-disulfide isomerase